MNKLGVGTDLDAALYGADKISEYDYLTAVATGRQLRESRRARGMTQIDMADLLGVTQSQISVWETGAEDIPRKHGMRIIDLLNNRRGQFDPFLRHLLKTDPWRVVKRDPMTLPQRGQVTYFHIGAEPRNRFFALPDSQLGRPIDSSGDWGLREPEYFILSQKHGRPLSKQTLSFDTVRQLSTLDGGKAIVRSREFGMEFEGSPRVVVSRYEYCGPGHDGFVPEVREHLCMEDLE